MDIQMPWGLIAIFLSLCIFYYVNKKNKIRRKERQEKPNDARQAFLDSLIKDNNKEQTIQKKIH